MLAPSRLAGMKGVAPVQACGYDAATSFARYGCGERRMEPMGVEPMTSCMPCKRAPNCATAPGLLSYYYTIANGNFLARRPHGVKDIKPPMLETSILRPPCRTSRPVQRRIILCMAPALYFSALAAFIWLALPIKGYLPGKIAFYIFAAAFPIVVNLLAGDTPADSGLRLDNLRPAAMQAAAATAIMAAIVVGVGIAAAGFHASKPARLPMMLCTYAAWGIAQQYLLQAFMLRRLVQAGVSGRAGAVVAAAAFAAVHSPNWVLVGATFIAGVVWCRIFIRRPNIITLGVSHGILAVLLYHALPKAWLHGLTIGPDFLRRAG